MISKLTPSLPIILLFASLGAHASNLKVPFSSTLALQNLGVEPGAGSTNLRARPGVPLRNAAVKVVASVKMGSRQTFHDVLVDTGSAILWVGGETPYQPGPNTHALNASFSVGYGTGGVSGTAFRDTVTIGEASAKKQIIGAANSTSGFALVKPIDGILGLGPAGSNTGEVFGRFANRSTPTFVETLVAEGCIKHAVFGVFITPLGVDGVPEGTGELTFGGADMDRVHGDIVWVAQNPPLNFHWDFNVTAFSFGSVGVTAPAPARTDTGVLGIGIPFDSLFDIIDAYNATIVITGALEGSLAFRSNTTLALPALAFTLGTRSTFSIPPSRYIVPPSLYASLNVTQVEGLVYTWITSAGPGAYQFGQKWLESVYTVYDLEKHRVGFAHLAK